MAGKTRKGTSKKQTDSGKRKTRGIAHPRKDRRPLKRSSVSKRGKQGILGPTFIPDDVF